MVRTGMAERTASVSNGAEVARRRLFSRLSFGHIVMICAGLLAFLLNVMVLRSKDETVEVSVAAQSITAGSRLSLQDVAYRHIDADGPFLERVLFREAIELLLGQVVIRDIDSGAPLLVDDLRPTAAPGAGRAMSIPITPDHAVGAALTVGDRVDVIAVDDDRSRFIATDIEVLSLSFSGNRTSGDRFGVTVAVSSDEALAIAGALDSGTVHLIRSTGSDKSAGSIESGNPVPGMIRSGS